MLLEIPTKLDECEIILDPKNIQLPEKLRLSLDEDGSIRLGYQMIVPPHHGDGQARYEEIKRAFSTGQYRIIINFRGEMQVEILK